MRLSDFDYELPESLIAKFPVEPRDHSRLLHVSRQGGPPSHRRFFELDTILQPGDLLVVNNTKVLPARLFGFDHKGRRFEVLLIKSLSGDRLHWDCLAKPGRKVGDDPLQFGEGVLGFLSRRPDRDFTIGFENVPSEGFLPWLERNGQLPIPPYLKREAKAADAHTYQTVYAQDHGSVAAPTAGLHFTPELLGRLAARGIERAEVTLHVGYGTFSPIQAEDVASHTMHSEEYTISDATFARLQEAKKAGRRIIAVGTTSLRALESLESRGLSGSTDIFIYPGYKFRWVDGLITNFHLPKSSLYVLVASLLGLERTRACYAEAIAENYRFYSYGDAMAIL